MRIKQSSLINSIIVLLLSIIIMPGVLSAQSVDELQSSVNSLNAQITALDKEIKDYTTKINQTQGVSKTLTSALASLELQRKNLVTKISLTNLQIQQTQDTISKTQSKITDTQSTIDKTKAGLAQLLVSRRNTETNLSPLLSLISAQANISSVFDEIKHSDDVSSQLQFKVNDLKDAQQELSSAKDQYVAQKDSLQKLQATLSDQKYVVDQTAQQKNQLLSETKSKESAYQAMLADKKKKKGELESEVLDFESKIKVAVDASKLPKYGKGVLQYPVDKVIITQYFGTTPFSTQNPQVYNGHGHSGVDFGAPIGTPVKAAADGVVVGTGDTDLACSGVSFGRWVLIRHSDGLSTLYAHLSKINVTANQQVTVGQQIALSGNTGYSTGPHVHFTVYASDSVHITGPTEYKSKVCGTYMILPVAPLNGYLNPLTYL